MPTKNMRYEVGDAPAPSGTKHKPQGGGKGVKQQTVERKGARLRFEKEAKQHFFATRTALDSHSTQYWRWRSGSGPYLMFANNRPRMARHGLSAATKTMGSFVKLLFSLLVCFCFGGQYRFIMWSL
jgi:hypothetical protein